MHIRIHSDTNQICRYRGKQESHDIGLTVTEKEDKFEHWARLWNIYHNQQLLTTFRELATHLGLKVCKCACGAVPCAEMRV